MDTLAYAKELETAGVSTKQAEAPARTLANAWDKEAVTKHELQEALDQRFADFQQRLNKDLDKRFAEFEKRLNLDGRLESFETRLKAELINELTKRMAAMLSLGIALLGILIGVLH